MLRTIWAEEASFPCRFSFLKGFRWYEYEMRQCFSVSQWSFVQNRVRKSNEEKRQQRKPVMVATLNENGGDPKRQPTIYLVYYYPNPTLLALTYRIKIFIPAVG